MDRGFDASGLGELAQPWEYSHLARFVLHLIAFGALIAALARAANER